MTKLRKQIILLKTSRLLKENQLLLFYHDPNRITGYKKISILPKFVTNLFELKPDATFGCKKSSELANFLERRPTFKPVGKQSLLQVKNKIAIKALRSVFPELFQLQPSLTSSQFYPLKHNKVCQSFAFSDGRLQENFSKDFKTLKEQNLNLLQSFSETSTVEKKKKTYNKISGLPDKANALLQGGTIIIGVKDLASARQNRANYPKFCYSGSESNGSNNILLMGGIYRAQLVNLKALKRLYNLDEEGVHYQKLCTFLRKSGLRLLLKSQPLQSIHKHTFCLFSCLQSKSILLIYILKNYHFSKPSKALFVSHIKAE